MKTILDETVRNILKKGEGKIVAIGLTKDSFRKDGELQAQVYLHILFDEYDDVPDGFDRFIADYEYERDAKNTDKKIFLSEDFGVLPEHMVIAWQRKDVLKF